jgi:hypothetical protein
MEQQVAHNREGKEAENHQTLFRLTLAFRAIMVL